MLHNRFSVCCYLSAGVRVGSSRALNPCCIIGAVCVVTLLLACVLCVESSRALNPFCVISLVCVANVALINRPVLLRPPVLYHSICSGDIN